MSDGGSITPITGGGSGGGSTTPTPTPSTIPGNYVSTPSLNIEGVAPMFATGSNSRLAGSLTFITSISPPAAADNNIEGVQDSGVPPAASAAAYAFIGTSIRGPIRLTRKKKTDPNPSLLYHL